MILSCWIIIKARVSQNIDWHCGILIHVSKVYTRTFFFNSWHEFSQVTSQRNVDAHVDDTRQFSNLQNGHIVQFDEVDYSNICTYHKFVTIGLLCYHALWVLQIDLDFLLCHRNIFWKDGQWMLWELLMCWVLLLVMKTTQRWVIVFWMVSRFKLQGYKVL